MNAPHKDEGVDVASADPLQATHENRNESVATDPEKLKATLKATAALVHGVSIFELSDGSFLATKWNLTRPLKDLHSVAAWLRQMGGSQ